MSWGRPFDEPIRFPSGKVITTLRQGGEYILSLPDKVRQHPKWHDAAEALTLVAERKGPPMFARMAFMLALNKDRPPAPQSDRTDKPWGKRPLKRDIH